MELRKDGGWAAGKEQSKNVNKKMLGINSLDVS